MSKEKQMHSLINMDCREGLKSLPDESAHVVLTDPPYGLDGMGENWSSEKLFAREKTASAKTASTGGLPPVQKFDRKQMDDLYSFLLPVWKEAYRILYPGGFLLSFGSPRLIGAISWAAHVAGFELRDEAIWEHEGGQPKAQRHTRWVQQMKISSAEKRRIVALLDDRTTVQLRPKYEPFIVAQKPANGTQVQNFVKYGVGLIKSYDLDGKYRTPIFQHPKPRTRGEFDHMTIKPLELIEDILGVFAGPHSVVVDPFTGSGTTGVAALHLGHSFIGFEKDSQHCATALQRLKEAYE